MIPPSAFFFGAGCEQLGQWLFESVRQWRQKRSTPKVEYGFACGFDLEMLGLGARGGPILDEASWFVIADEASRLPPQY